MAYKIVTPSVKFSAYLQSQKPLLKNGLTGVELHTAKGRTRHIHDIIKNAPSKSFLKRGQKKEYFILDNLSSFIMDEEDINEAYFRDTFDVIIHDNFEVSSINPTEGAISNAQSTLPDFWHKRKLNLSSLNLTGKNVNIGVLDSGIYSSHQEFEGKLIKFAEFDALGQFKGIIPKDYGTHGTHVCGLLAGNNAGVAPDVSLTVVACLTERGGTAGYLAQILGGLNYLLEQGNNGNTDEKIHIINASIESSSGYNDYLHAALNTAITEPGTLMVAAIGNNGSLGEDSDSSPGNYDLTLGIGALDENDVVASFSSWGMVAQSGNISKPDLSAPGVSLYSSLSGPGNRYFQQSGTSMASPIVAGMAALLLEREPELLLQPLKIKQKLIDLVVAIPNPVRAGHGRVNL